MKYLILVLFFFAFEFYAFSGNNKQIPGSELMDNIRKVYYDAVEDENKIEDLSNLINNNFNSGKFDCPPIIIAYKAGIEALKSKHAFWPFTKLEKLNDSMEIFSEAVKLNPDNLEIRFMRFSILHYVPSFLGYTNEMNDDLNKITTLLAENITDGLDKFIIKGIIEFILASGRGNENQINFLNSLLNKYENS